MKYHRRAMIHPIYYALIPDLAQTERAIDILDAKIRELRGDDEMGGDDKVGAEEK